MKICHFDFSKPLELKCGSAVLVTENASRFAQYCQDFVCQQGGEEGNFLIDDARQTLSFKKAGSIIFDFFNLSLTDRKIVAGVYDAIEKTATEEYALDYSELRSKIMSFIDLLSIDSPLQIEYNDDFCLQDMLKALKVQPCEEEKPLICKIADYMDAASAFLGIRIFVLVNLRTFVSDDDFSLLLTHIGHSDYSVLFLEKTQYERVSGEPVRIIDNDLCEIIVEDDFV